MCLTILVVCFSCYFVRHITFRYCILSFVFIFVFLQNFWSSAQSSCNLHILLINLYDLHSPDSPPPPVSKNWHTTIITCWFPEWFLSHYVTYIEVDGGFLSACDILLSLCDSLIGFFFFVPLIFSACFGSAIQSSKFLNIVLIFSFANII